MERRTTGIRSSSYVYRLSSGFLKRSTTGNATLTSTKSHAHQKKIKDVMTILTLPSHGDFHSEIEEIGVTVAHAVLGEQETHDLATGGPRTHGDGLVLDV